MSLMRGQSPRAAFMLSLDDLANYSLKVDLSKYVATTQGFSGIRFMEKLTLGILRESSFSEAHIALGKIKTLIPVIGYSQYVGRYHVQLALFEDMKMQLEIEKPKETIEIGGPGKEDRNLVETDLQKLGTDFNFLLGNMRGILTVREMPSIEAHSTFRRAEQLLPTEKLGALRNDIRALLGNPRTEVLGLRLESYDDSGTKHVLDVSQHKDDILFGDTFEFQPAGPVVLERILDKSLRLVNSIYAKLGGS
jgi:hypothetical protein